MANLGYGLEQPVIWRRARQPTVTIKVAISGQPAAATIVTQLAPELKKFNASLPPGYKAVVGGAVEESAKSQGPINDVLPLMLFLMATILMIQLQSFHRLRWNGTKWSMQAVPHPRGVPYTFYNVACRATTDCVAVGEIDGAAGAGTTLIMHWNGSTWTLEPTPATPGHSAFIEDVRCPSASNCLAVGDTYTPAGTNAITDVSGIAERWDGHTWTMLPTAPLASGTTTDFSAVACPASSTCVVVGSTDDSGVAPLAERWNGSTFTLDTTQSVGTFSYFNSVNCNGGSCVAVGAGDPTGSVDRTLVERTT